MSTESNISLKEFQYYLEGLVMKFAEKIKGYDDLPESMPLAAWLEQWASFYELEEDE